MCKLFNYVTNNISGNINILMFNWIDKLCLEMKSKLFCIHNFIENEKNKFWEDNYFEIENLICT